MRRTYDVIVNRQCDLWTSSVSDRRNPKKQHLVPGGERAEDPPADDDWLNTRECADRLGVSTAFVIGEIRDGRLNALVIERPNVRTLYRVRPGALAQYIARYRWHDEQPPKAS